MRLPGFIQRLFNGNPTDAKPQPRASTFAAERNPNDEHACVEEILLLLAS